MINILVLDGTENIAVGSLLSEYLVPPHYVDVVDKPESAVSRVQSNHYDMIVLTEAKSNKSDLYDVSEAISASMKNRTSVIILILDNPTLRERISGRLRGRQMRRFETAELDKFETFIKENLV